MKRIYTMIMALFAIAVVATSCTNTKPHFDYQIEVSGDLSFTEAKTVSNFTAFASNVTNPMLMLVNADHDAPEARAVVTDAEGYFESQIKAAVPANTYYNIVIKGTVTESFTGITVNINKTFSNFPGDYILPRTPIIDDVEPTISDTIIG